MKLTESVKKHGSFSQKAARLALWASLAGLPATPRMEAGNLALYDTVEPYTGSAAVAGKAAWKLVPRDLLTLEADPPKASSDPGYYGREYAFKGDAVVENRSLAAVFSSAQGRVVIYSKADSASPAGVSPDPSGFGRKVVECVPRQIKGQPGTITHCDIIRNAGDEVALDAFFSTKGGPELSARFIFGKGGIVEIKPAENTKGISLLSAVRYGVVPSFIGDDLIFDSAAPSAGNHLSIPSENLFLGLLSGEESMLVLTWPNGKQQLTLDLGKEEEGKRLIESVDFGNDGQSLYLAALTSPGIWHREELKPSHLEKDVPINWTRPFPAKWKTQLDEGGVPTTFAFRASKGTVWRGVPGSYNYPVWFEGDQAFCHLSKKVPPKEEALLYFVEGQETPLSIQTPAEIMQEALGRPMSEPILDIAGRKLHTHHRRGGEGVRRACTCGCTEVIQAVFEAGQEVARKDDVQGAIDDMIYFVQRHMGRIDEYRRFADDLIKFLRAKAAAAPELKSYLDGLEQIAQQIHEEYRVQKENMGSLEYAGQLTRQTMALTGKKDPNNLKAYMDLLKAWRAMGGAQDYVLAQCHTITRKLCQEAGYAAVDQPKAAPLAAEIRARCRAALRNPDGYEIWADY